MAGRAGGDSDQVAADGGGPDQVVRDGGDGQPGGAGGELPRGQVGQGAVAEVGEELLDDGVAAVLLLGLDELVRAVGEDGVVAPGGNSSPWPGAAFALSRTRRTISRAVTCSSFFFEVKAVYCVSATSASETQQPSWSSQMACGYSMAVQASSGMAAIAARIAALTGAVTENRAPLRRIAAITAAA
jgi:hypothetical protein